MSVELSAEQKLAGLTWTWDADGGKRRAQRRTLSRSGGLGFRFPACPLALLFSLLLLFRLTFESLELESVRLGRALVLDRLRLLFRASAAAAPAPS